MFLRGALLANLDTQLVQLAQTDVAHSLMTFDIGPDGDLIVDDADNAPPADYAVAVYSPIDGRFLGSAGGTGPSEPDFPPTLTLLEAKQKELEPVALASMDGDSEFRAAVSVQPYENTAYPQLVALPVTGVNRAVATSLGIYSIIAVFAIVFGAVLTRLLVTFAFRSLGQVESTAMAIASGDFGQRMTDIEPTTTEVGRLKTAINAMLGRVDTAISQRDATVRQMRRFIGDASHELRTPLVTVRGYAELYRMGAIRGDEDIAQAMDRIESEAKRMGVLVEDLLALARLDERRDVVITPVDLRPVARDAALDVRATSPLRPVTVVDTTADEPRDPSPAQAPDTESAKRPNTSAIARAGASLSLLRRKPKPVPATSATGMGEPSVQQMHLASEPSKPSSAPAPIVLGDENRIRQVVTNLLGNARRFTGDDSPIELRVGIDTAMAMGWIEIVDHGEGIPDQIKDKIFQRFWRADTSRTRETGGTGLGLSIVASIVEALHGTVSVADTPGGGATFRVSLPLAEPRDASEHLHLETQPLRRLTDLTD
ncbi:sensor histidine kinase [Microbacterium sp.]|uniref:sensor histidine kinase n=1 Tax=Microbacterium sp. TaxID=51671 RepID=UPI003F70F050